jgi:hypothetical protein
MYKIEYSSKTVIVYDENHKGAKYFVNGAYKNEGELIECGRSERAGLGFRKDGNTAYNMGSDVADISVKSGRARLTTIRLANDRLTFIDKYLENEPSKSFSYGIYNGNGKFTFYEMSREEFREFAVTFTKWTPSESTPRFPVTSKEVVRWLEERL